LLLGLILFSVIANPRNHVGRLRLAILFLIAEASALILEGVRDPLARPLLVSGIGLLVLGTWAALASFARVGDGDEGYAWLTWIFVVQIGIPLTVLVFAGLAYAEIAVSRDLAPALLAVGAAILLYALGQFVIVASVTAPGAMNEDTAFPKSYHESMRLIANVLVVVNGVLLGLVKDATNFEYRSAALLVLGIGILVGVFHLSVLVGGVHREYTEKRQNGANEVTDSYVALHPVHQHASTVLLNLQFYSLLVGTALIAADSRW
jgi:hypothetical protein